MQIQISEEFIQICPHFIGACIQAQVKNSPYDSALWVEIKAQSTKLKATHTTQSIKDITSVCATRHIYRLAGKDPSRYRPAAEALMRRIIQDKELYQISTLVDIINLASIVYGYSIGGFDTQRFNGDKLVLGIGKADEPYLGIGRGAINIAGMPVYRDANGGVGTPTSDHERTKITPETRHVTILINGYDGDLSRVTETSDYLKTLLVKHADATDLNVSYYKSFL